MEHGYFIDDNKRNVCDYNFTRYVGWTKHAGFSQIFSSESIRKISFRITELLTGVDSQGRPIIVPDNTICSMLTTVYENYKPRTGDIQSRFIIERTEDSYLSDIVDRTIQIIVQHVKDSLGIEANNNNLTIWTTVLGDFNTAGLRSHPLIKIRNKHPTRMQFHMNY